MRFASRAHVLLLLVGLGAAGCTKAGPAEVRADEFERLAAAPEADSVVIGYRGDVRRELDAISERLLQDHQLSIRDQRRHAQLLDGVAPGAFVGRLCARFGAPDGERVPYVIRHKPSGQVFTATFADGMAAYGATTEATQREPGAAALREVLGRFDALLDATEPSETCALVIGTGQGLTRVGVRQGRPFAEPLPTGEIMERLFAQLAALPPDDLEARRQVGLELLLLWQHGGDDVAPSAAQREVLRGAWLRELTHQEALTKAQRLTSVLEMLDAAAAALGVDAERPRLTALLAERGSDADGVGGSVLDLIDQCLEGAAAACPAALDVAAQLTKAVRAELPREDLVAVYTRVLERSERQVKLPEQVEGAAPRQRLVELAKALGMPAALAARARALAE